MNEVRSRGYTQLSKSVTVLYALNEPDQMVVPARAPATKSSNDANLDEYFMAENAKVPHTLDATNSVICIKRTLFRNKPRIYLHGEYWREVRPLLKG